MHFTPEEIEFMRKRDERYAAEGRFSLRKRPEDIPREDPAVKAQIQRKFEERRRRDAEELLAQINASEDPVEALAQALDEAREAWY